MGNFTVKPANLNESSKALKDELAPGYGTAAADVRAQGPIDAPGMGLVLSFLDAMYDSRLDYVVKDLEGTKDVLQDIAHALETTVAQYNAAEDLNVAGFGGPGEASQGTGSGLPSSIGDALGVTTLVTAPTYLVAASVMFATSSAASACAGLCRSFIPVAIAIPGFCANVIDLWQTGEMWQTKALLIRDTLNVGLEAAFSHAKDGWEGTGAMGFDEMTSRITTHLGTLAGYMEAIGGVLQGIAITLGILWAGIIVFVPTFLVWLISMNLAAIGPQAPAVIAIIESVGAAATSGWMTAFVAASGAAGALAMVIGFVNQQLITVYNKPDSDADGTPDMQEFSVDVNFA